jgi:hypothetical protein
MPDNKRHHYVPQFYLRLFANQPKRKGISLYNLRSNKHVRNAPIDRQAYRNYFYSKVSLYEKSLADLEGVAAPLFQKIVAQDYVPTPREPDHNTLITFVLFLYRRTVAAADEQNELVNALAHRLLAMHPTAREFHTKGKNRCQV